METTVCEIQAANVKTDFMVRLRPLWPSKPFESLEKAREWVAKFVTWYNEEHRHSGIPPC
jgi:transposase InsO family protein